MAELADIVADFARGIAEADARHPQALNQRSKVPYQAGIGPHTEVATLSLVMDELVRSTPDRYRRHQIGVPYPDAVRQRCDLGIGSEPEWDWLIEVKMVRMLGDNAKQNDNLPTHILSPYPAHRSALTDCEKLGSSSLVGRKVILMYGYEADDWPLESLVQSFEVLARRRVSLGERQSASFDRLIHPVHRSGRVHAWELTSSARTRAEAEREAAFGRLAHSFESVLYAADWLAAQSRRPNPERDSGWNAHIESFLIHARKLMDFLDPRSNPRRDDVVPGDFARGADRFPVDVDDAVRDQISKRLAHITYAPVLGQRGQPEWPIWAMRDALVDAMGGFINALGSSDFPGVRRLERAMHNPAVAYRKQLSETDQVGH